MPLSLKRTSLSYIPDFGALSSDAVSYLRPSNVSQASWIASWMADMPNRELTTGTDELMLWRYTYQIDVFMTQTLTVSEV